MKGVTPPTKSPTVTVPRETWERVQAVADEWNSLDTVLKAGLAADLSEIGFNEFVVNALVSKMTKIKERFATPLNAVEEGSNLPRANSVTGAEQEPQS